MTKKIGFFIGSLRKDSYNKKVAEAFAKLLPEGYESVFVKIDDLPFYNEDLETPEQAPAEWTRFREEVRGLDGVVFVTPEYNRSVPAVLKNALDVGSRPYGHSVWEIADRKAPAVDIFSLYRSCFFHLISVFSFSSYFS